MGRARGARAWESHPVTSGGRVSSHAQASPLLRPQRYKCSSHRGAPLFSTTTTLHPHLASRSCGLQASPPPSRLRLARNDADVWRSQHTDGQDTHSAPPLPPPLPGCCTSLPFHAHAVVRRLSSPLLASSCSDSPIPIPAPLHSLPVEPERASVHAAPPRRRSTFALPLTGCGQRMRSALHESCSCDADRIPLQPSSERKGERAMTAPRPDSSAITARLGAAASS
ncbi:hypothetical protein FA09DRAFT_115457 [Tilletiopsis washingtonensis]|uniref:Uncharacterized protein n=1 Tax=Tilletiopsis washingtonensis TaxID=58919 RepID=A0A316ZGE0_9BASI|nr:hypothetical protein FA09DRAFT_115457 [Tilletiopsis washingtonensis]PWO00828.1 hypothetical protein FA09DRAFT_115457 [Tilletiopsis washingtonensis]